MKVAPVPRGSRTYPPELYDAIKNSAKSTKICFATPAQNADEKHVSAVKLLMERYGS